MKICVDGFDDFFISAKNEEHKKFWNQLEAGQWEAGTIAAIRQNCGPGRVFWDVGTWIGPTTLLAAARGSHVLAFEPDSQALAFLNKNLELNPPLKQRVRVVSKALARKSGELRLRAQDAFGDSMSSLVGRGQVGTDVETIGVGEALRSFPLPAASMVKVDIEGGEYLLGREFWATIKQKSCSILLSTHPTILAPLYRAPGLSRVNQLLAIALGFIPSFQMFLQLRGMSFRGDFDPSTGKFRKLPSLRVLIRFLSGKNHTFLCQAESD